MIGLKNKDNTSAFAIFEKFEGETIDVEIKPLIDALELLKAMKKAGFESIRVGIEQSKKLVLLLNEENTMGYIMVGLAENKNMFDYKGKGGE